MLGNAFSGPNRGRSAAVTAVLFLGFLIGCEERDRLTFLDPGDGVGPETVIDHPGQDTTIVPGGTLVVQAFARDPDGVDTVYFRTTGPIPGFQPLRPGGVDSVRFGVPLGTSGLSNDTIILQIFATDVSGNRGDTATREIYLP